LSRYLAGFEDEFAPAPIEFLTMDIEHFCFLSWFCGHESHEQDGERLRGAEIPRPVAASGDPAMTFMPIERRTLIARRCGGLDRRHGSGCNQASAEMRACLARRMVSGGFRASR
jgi:hypothetical protein